MDYKTIPSGLMATRTARGPRRHHPPHTTLNTPEMMTDREQERQTEWRRKTENGSDKHSERNMIHRNRRRSCVRERETHGGIWQLREYNWWGGGRGSTYSQTLPYDTHTHMGLKQVREYNWCVHLSEHRSASQNPDAGLCLHTARFEILPYEARWHYSFDPPGCLWPQPAGLFNSSSQHGWSGIYPVHFFFIMTHFSWHL